ncbi:MAG: hypothetical protein WCS94_14205 [Verrucomicrobiota bacterium]
MSEKKTKIQREGRRNVAISGPIAVTFARTCRALCVNQQTVVDELVGGWNQRNARRARHALEAQAAALGACHSGVSSDASLTPAHQNTTEQS